MPEDDDEGRGETCANDGQCDCLGCQMKRQIESINRSNQANGAANCRRDIWIGVFMERIKNDDHPITAAKVAAQSVLEFDKAFPEVKDTAMTEDR